MVDGVMNKVDLQSQRGEMCWKRDFPDKDSNQVIRIRLDLKKNGLPVNTITKPVFTKLILMLRQAQIQLQVQQVEFLLEDKALIVEDKVTVGVKWMVVVMFILEVS